MAQRGELEAVELDEACTTPGCELLPNVCRSTHGARSRHLLPRCERVVGGVHRPDSGETLLAVPAIEIDVALLHASISDKFGNVQHSGTGSVIAPSLRRPMSWWFP